MEGKSVPEIVQGALIGIAGAIVGAIITAIVAYINTKSQLNLRIYELAASHNWWKFDLAISYTLLPSQSIPLSNQCFL
jgi:ABC-type lipoprotein release transport system permease subunit